MTPKFRAWDKDKKWIVYDVQDAYDGLWSERNSDEVNDYYSYVSTFRSFTDEEEFNLMQSIGRTGMNKKDDEVDIFQGDIIQVIEQGHQMGFYVENEYVGVIEYDKGHCAYFLKLIETNFHNEIPDEVDGITIFKGDEEPERYYFNDIDFLVPEDITILGNVYENPELLEEQNK